MFKSGLVSISFRGHSPREIIEAAAKAGTELIEWGGDIHVPAGDYENARRVGRMTRDAGLIPAAYGSYYRLGQPENAKSIFEQNIRTAAELGAPVIRVWAGNLASEKADSDNRRRVADDARAAAELAEKFDINIALECHSGTLTDHWQSTEELMTAVNHPRLKLYWQPNQFHSETYNLKAAEVMAENTLNLHVFHWDSKNKYPLNEGTEIWQKYLKIFEQTGRDYGLLLEFMHDDSIESLPEAARTLHEWIQALQ